MSPPLVYIDRSAVREGAVDELRAAIGDLVRFIEENITQVLSYGVYLSDDGTEMTVVHVHRDTASLEQHLETGGPVFRRFADLLTLQSIRVYGEVSESALSLLHEKARTLGVDDVAVVAPHAGFSRLPPKT